MRAVIALLALALVGATFQGSFIGSLIGAPSGNGGAACTSETIVASNVPSRTTCVAPCFVRFDATGTTDSATTHEFHDLLYEWEFDDPTAGDWTHGAASIDGSWPKNRDTGPLSGHVFDAGGTYTVELVASNATGCDAATSTITVTAADTQWASTTACISTGADFSACPSVSTGDHFQIGVTSGCADWDNCVATARNDGSRRILSKRGESFSASGAAALNVAGPGLLGAFGSGALPVISTSGCVSIQNSDWRVQNIRCVGSNVQFSSGVSVGSGVGHALIYGVEAGGYQWTFDGAGTESDHNALVGSVSGTGMGVESLNGAYQFTTGRGDNWSLIGNRIENDAVGAQSTQHNIRIWSGNKLLFAHNKLGPSTAVHAEVTINYDGTDNPLIRYTQFHDNHLVKRAGVSGVILVSGGIGGVQDIFRWEDILFENNFYDLRIAEGATWGAVTVGIANRFTIRNNTFVQGPGGVGAVFARHPVDSNDGPAAAQNVWVYNNSVYGAAGLGWEEGWTGVIARSDPAIVDMEVRNNLYWTDTTVPTPVFVDGCGAGCTATNNYDRRAGTLTSNPYTATTPTSPADFVLSSGSVPPVDNGFARVGLFWDFFRGVRTGLVDVGAHEFGSAADW